MLTTPKMSPDGAPAGGGGAPAAGGGGGTGSVPSVPTHASSGGGTAPAGAPPAPANAAPPTAEKAAKGDLPKEPTRFTRKVKLYGEEKEVSLTEDEMWARIQKEEAWEVRQRKAAEREAQVKALADEMDGYEEEILQNPRAVLERIAKRRNVELDPLDYLVRHLEPLVQEREMDPRDRELAALRAEKQTREQEAKTASEKQAENERLAAEDKRLAGAGARLVQATKAAGLPQDPFILEMMGKAFIRAEDAGLDPSPQDIVADTMEMLTGHTESLASKFSDGDESILDRFPVFQAKIHKALLAKFKRMQGGGAAAPVVNPNAPKPNGVETMKERIFRGPTD